MAKWLVAITALGCAVIWAIPGGAADTSDKKGKLDDADVKAVVDFNAKVIQGALSQEKVTRALARKARTAAMMIAAAAQSGGSARNAQLATERDAALKIVEAIDQDKFADALASAKSLPSLKPDANAKLEAVPIFNKDFKLDDVMDQFQGERSGGLAINSKLDGWEDELPKDLGEVADVANQLSLVFEVVGSHHAKAELGTQEQWDKFSDTARARAEALRTAARAGKEDDTKKAVKAVNASCVDCHKVFRPKPGG